MTTYMTPTNYEDVLAFHNKYGAGTNDKPLSTQVGQRDVPDEWLKFRVDFMEEELQEFKDALEAGDEPKAFDALLDLVYVAIGTAIGKGFPWQSGWKEVQRANMTKVRASSASDSARGVAYDVVKPPDFQPPDIAEVLRKFGWEL